MSLAGERVPAAATEQIAEEALRTALTDLCRGASWRGLARGLAWRVVTAGEREPRAMDALSTTAEQLLAAEIDDALWSVERTALRSLEEFLEARPGDVAGALSAARLDAGEESRQVVGSACERVLRALLGTARQAA